MVVSYLAVLVALSGTASALPGTNTVRTDDIVDGQVTVQDVASRAVRSPELVDLSVGRAEISNTFELRGSEIAPNSVAGEELSARSVHARALAGNTVTASKVGTLTQRSATITVPGGTGGNSDLNTEDVTVACEFGTTEVAVGASVLWDQGAGGASDDDELTITYGHFNQATQPTSYTARGGNDSGTNHDLTVRILCLEQGG